MRKFLLFAAAAVVAVSANAQSLTKGISGHPYTAKKVAKGELKSLKDTKITSFRSSAATLALKNIAKNNGVTSLKAVNQINNVTSVRRAGVIQESYNGSGKDYFTQNDASWTMKSATATDETPLLVDVIPLPEDWASLESVPVKYTLS